jgi:hypothetical protein
MAPPARTRENVRDFIELATRRFRQALAARVSAHERAGNEVWRVLGDPDALAERAIAATVPEPSAWNELVGPFTRTEGVQARLGITRQAIASKAARRRLLRVITVDGAHLYPIWQFAGPGLLPGLADVLALFAEDAVDGWTLAGWLRTSDPELGEPPLDALARGEAERVFAVARVAARSLAA